MDSDLDILHHLLEKARRLGADAADAILIDSVDLSASRRMQKPEGLERSESRALGLRTFCSGRQAIASTSDFGQDALDALAERAIAMARCVPPDPDSALAPEALRSRHPPALDLLDAGEPSPEWLQEQCETAEDAALAVSGIENSEGASAHWGRHRVSLASLNGHGFAQGYESSNFSVSVSVLAGQDGVMERDWDFTQARHREDLQSSAEIGRRAAQRTLRKLGARKLASRRAPVVFDPRVGKSLLSILAGAISGNAVARGSSFLKESLGQAVFAGGVVITDDPHRIRGLNSKPFDAEGVANAKRAIVENGELKTWLLDIRTAGKLKLVTTGHASRGIASPPAPSPTNLYMEKGALPPQALIKETGEGFYVTETFGMGVNTTTGDYSQGASGFWIEDGEIAYPVSEITIAGKLQDMFARLTPADDLEFRYGVNAPTFRVDAMTVAGT